MRLFRANQTPRTPEDEAAAVRLMAIANRGKVASLPERDTAAPEASGEAQSPESIQ